MSKTLKRLKKKNLWIIKVYNLDYSYKINESSIHTPKPNNKNFKHNCYLQISGSRKCQKLRYRNDKTTSQRLIRNKIKREILIELNNYNNK